jgi:hypothetical protein
VRSPLDSAQNADVGHDLPWGGDPARERRRSAGIMNIQLTRVSCSSLSPGSARSRLHVPLGLLAPIAGEFPDRRASRAWPAFTGIGDSGRTDVSERADELLAEGFGR